MLNLTESHNDINIAEPLIKLTPINRSSVMKQGDKVFKNIIKSMKFPYMSKNQVKKKKVFCDKSENTRYLIVNPKKSRLKTQ